MELRRGLIRMLGLRVAAYNGASTGSSGFVSARIRASGTARGAAVSTLSLCSRRLKGWSLMLSNNHSTSNCHFDADGNGVHNNMLDSADGGTTATGTRLYVANISSGTSERDLIAFFRRYGTVEECFVPEDRYHADNSRHRGFAFVTMRDEDEAANAVSAACEGRLILDGRKLLVSAAFPRGRRKTFQSDSTKETYQTPYTINDSLCPPTNSIVLQTVVQKHIKTLDKYLLSRPVAAHTCQAFDEVKEFIESFFPGGSPNIGSRQGLILDSGCGTGRSSLTLGKMFPEDIVIGIDRSLSRLSRNAVYRDVQIKHSLGSFDVEGICLTRSDPNHPNVLLVRAELSDFWRLCIREGWILKKHYLLYPNPYPKRARLKSRFYAHPSFPLILKLGGDVIVRSNWEGYVKEFASCVVYADEFLNDDECKPTGDNYAHKYANAAKAGPMHLGEIYDPLTNFEEKYALCGERLYELRLGWDRTLHP